MGEAPFAPRPTGNPVEPPELAGQLLAWDGGHPVWLRMPASPHLYIACFRDEEGLRSFYRGLGISFDRIKRIDDGPEFLSSFVGHDVVVVCNVRFTETGRVRFTQLNLSSENS